MSESLIGWICFMLSILWIVGVIVSIPIFAYIGHPKKGKYPDMFDYEGAGPPKTYLDLYMCAVCAASLWFVWIGFGIMETWWPIT